MRRHTDRHGRTWDVVLGRESFGALYALFVEAHGDETRQTLLRATSQAEAEAELDAMSSGDLDDLLERSEPKETG